MLWKLQSAKRITSDSWRTAQARIARTTIKGLENYRDMRVQGDAGGGDAPEYEEYCKAAEKRKRQDKAAEKRKRQDKAPV